MVPQDMCTRTGDRTLCHPVLSIEAELQISSRCEGQATGWQDLPQRLAVVVHCQGAHAGETVSECLWLLILIRAQEVLLIGVGVAPMVEAAAEFCIVTDLWSERAIESQTRGADL